MSHDENDQLDSNDSIDERGFRWNWGETDNWIWGVVLLTAGVLLLLQNFAGVQIVDMSHWWVIFLLVPGLSNLTKAVRIYQKHSRLTPSSRSLAFWGFVLVAISVSLLFDLAWHITMPSLLILAGVFLLATPSKT